MTVTITDRQNASKAIRKIRITHTRTQIADLIGINPTYVTTAQNRTMKGEHYHCPSGVIIAILKHAGVELQK